MIKHLRELAHDSGRTIICVIHQPSSSLFQLFDDVYLLSHGHCIYNGPLEDMVDSFKRAGFNCPTSYYNRADYALEVASGMQAGVNDSNIEQLIDLARTRGVEADNGFYGGDGTTNNNNSNGPNSLPEIVTNGVNADMRTLLPSHRTATVYPETTWPTVGRVEVEMTVPEKVDYPVSTWRQIGVLTKRSMLCMLRDFVS